MAAGDTEIAAGAGVGAGALVVGKLSSTPPLTPACRDELRYDKVSVVEKKITAATPVDFDRKLEEPVAPNKLPDAPDPKAAPMSAPLPCCTRTRPTMVSADKTCTKIMILISKVFIKYFFRFLVDSD